MKKTFVTLLMAIMAVFSVSVVFAACGGNAKPKVNVTFTENGAETQTVSVEKGKKIEASLIPAYSGNEAYAFEGWFVGATPVADYVFDADTTVTAKLTKIHTVTFKSGEATVKTVKVRDGEKLKSADVPADPDVADYFFDGWWIDANTRFDANTAIKADTTVTAKLTKIHTVTFKSGETTVKTVKVRDGEKLTAADVPADPDVADYLFDGWWIDEDMQFDANTVIEADTMVTAKFVKVVFSIKFVVGDLETVIKTDDEGYFSSADIPAVTAPEGEMFVGWVDENGIQANFAGSNLVMEDATYTAYFADKFATYVGAESKTEARVAEESGNLYLWLNGKKILTKLNVASNNALSCKDSSKTWTFTFGFEGAAVLTCYYYDGMEEDFVTDTYQFTAFTKSDTTAYSGTYIGAESHKVELAGDGTLRLFNTESTLFATAFSVEGNAITLKYATPYSSFPGSKIYTYSGTLNGNILTLQGGEVGGTQSTYQYYKGTMDDRTQYVATVNDVRTYLYVFKQNTDEAAVLIYRYAEPKLYSFVTPDTAAINGAKLNFTIEGQEYSVKLLDDATFIFRDELNGTYTSAGDDALELDGFGVAKVGNANYTYRSFGKQVILYDGEAVLRGVEVDPLTDTYTSLSQNAIAGEYTAIDGSVTYHIVFDGYGHSTIFYTQYNRDYNYSGTYAYENAVMTHKSNNSSGDYYFGGEFSVFQTEKILVQITGKKLKYVAVGYTPIEPDVNVFAGTWTAEEHKLIVNTSEMLASYNNKLAEISIDYDNVVKFTMDNVTYSLTVSGENMILKGGADPITLTKESDLSDLPLIITDQNLVGEFTFKYDEYGDIYSDKIVVTKSGLVTVEGRKGFATFEEGALVVVTQYSSYLYRYTLKFENSQYKLSKESRSASSQTWKADWTAISVEKVKIFSEAFVDTFTGNMSGNFGSGAATIVIDNVGKAIYTRGSSTFTFTNYTEVNNGYKWTNGDYELTVTFGGGSYSVKLEDTLESYISTGAFTKGEIADALKGTWKQGSNVLTADGAGNCTLDNGMGGKFNFTYTVSGKNVTFTGSKPVNFAGGATLSADGSTLVIQFDDGDGEYPMTYTKQ